MKPKVTCDKCGGSGDMSLPEPLQQTFDAVRKNTTTEDLHKRFPNISRTAQNNRMEALRKMGLLIRERAGKWWLYSRAVTLNHKH